MSNRFEEIEILGGDYTDDDSVFIITSKKKKVLHLRRTYKNGTFKKNM